MKYFIFLFLSLFVFSVAQAEQCTAVGSGCDSSHVGEVAESHQDPTGECREIYRGSSKGLSTYIPTDSSSQEVQSI